MWPLKIIPVVSLIHHKNYIKLFYAFPTYLNMESYFILFWFLHYKYVNFFFRNCYLSLLTYTDIKVYQSVRYNAAHNFIFHSKLATYLRAVPLMDQWAVPIRNIYVIQMCAWCRYKVIGYGKLNMKLSQYSGFLKKKNTYSEANSVVN